MSKQEEIDKILEVLARLLEWAEDNRIHEYDDHEPVVFSDARRVIREGYRPN